MISNDIIPCGFTIKFLNLVAWFWWDMVVGSVNDHNSKKKCFCTLCKILVLTVMEQPHYQVFRIFLHSQIAVYKNTVLIWLCSFSVLRPCRQICLHSTFEIIYPNLLLGNTHWFRKIMRANMLSQHKGKSEGKFNSKEFLYVSICCNWLFTFTLLLLWLLHNVDCVG